MKNNMFQLQQIIHSEEIAEQHDTVGVLELSPTMKRSSKLGVEKRKSKSFQSAISSLTPNPMRRLDTISQEESNIPITEKKQNSEFMYGSQSGGKFKIRERFSEGLKQDSQGFQSTLKRQSTWIQKNLRTDNQLVSSFQNSYSVPNIHQSLRQQQKRQKPLLTEPPIKKTKSKKSSDHQAIYLNSKNSKMTKDTEFQDDEHSNSYLDKSTLLTDLQKSQLNITPEQQFCFKIKWILLVFVVLILAIFSSFSNDNFEIKQTKKEKVKKNKINNKLQQAHRKNQKTKTKKNKRKNKNQIHF